MMCRMTSLALSRAPSCAEIYPRRIPARHMRTVSNLLLVFADDRTTPAELDMKHVEKKRGAPAPPREAGLLRPRSSAPGVRTAILPSQPQRIRAIPMIETDQTVIERVRREQPCPAANSPQASIVSQRSDQGHTTSAEPPLRSGDCFND